MWQHRDVAQVVERREDAQLAELGDARDEDELLVGIAHLDHLVELLHDASHLFQFLWLMKVIKDGSIVFVEDDYSFQTCLSMGVLDELLESGSWRPFRFRPTIFFLVIVQLAVQLVNDLLHLPLVLARTDVEMQHGILLPLLLQIGHGETLEQVLAALEIVFQGAAKQRLAEPARTAEEDELRFVAQPVNQVGLVNVDTPVFADAFKIGDACGVESHFFHKKEGFLAAKIA